MNTKDLPKNPVLKNNERWIITMPIGHDGISFGNIICQQGGKHKIMGANIKVTFDGITQQVPYTNGNSFEKEKFYPNNDSKSTSDIFDRLPKQTLEIELNLFLSPQEKNAKEKYKDYNFEIITIFYEIQKPLTDTLPPLRLE